MGGPDSHLRVRSSKQWAFDTVSSATIASRPLAARRAVSALFVLNGVAYANVVPRLPAIKADLALSNAALGAALAAMPVGALLAGVLGGRLIARFDSARVVVAAGVALGLATPLLAAAPAWIALVGAFAVVGAADSSMDIAMNAQALRVQRGYGRSIMSSMHGLWSVGALIGGGIGLLCAAADVPLSAHLAIAGALVAASVLGVRRWLVHGRDGGRSSPTASPGADRASASRARRLALVPLGLIVIGGATIEDAPASWGAVLVRSELGASAAVAGSVYLAFQVSMTVGRVTGDRVVDRFGAPGVLRAGALTVAIGMGLAVATREPAIVIVGFVIAGLGASPLFPLAFSAAGEVEGVAPGHGLAVIASTARIGFLISPLVVGVIGDATDLRVGLLIAPVAALAVALAAPALPAPARRR